MTPKVRWGQEKQKENGESDRESVAHHERYVKVPFNSKTLRTFLDKVF